MDDAELFIMGRSNSPAAIMSKAELATNVWREVLEVTGGAMRPQKCAWTLVTYKKSTDLVILPIQTCQGGIHIPDENHELQAVSRYDGKVCREYLGVSQRVDSSEVDQMKKMLSQVGIWNQRMKNSTLYREYNMTVLSRINRTLQYTLPALSLSEKECQKIINKLYTACLPKFGIVSSLPLKRMYLPYTYQGGLQLHDLYIKQDIGHIHEILQVSVSKGICWDQLIIDIEAIQIEIGSISFPFNNRSIRLASLLSSSWYTSVWQFFPE